MAPVKFDDIKKTAADVLNEDHHNSGYQVKHKAKTGWDGAVVTTTVEVLPGAGKGTVVTPAKSVSWKFPKPFGIAGFAIDKLEMDKNGGYKLEASADKGSHTIDDLKVDVKSDLTSFDKLKVACTFTGIKDTRIAVEGAALKPDSSVVEVTRGIGKEIVVGAKVAMKSYMAPDFGARYTHGPIFAALTVQEKFGTFNCFAMYKVNADLKIACTYQHGGKDTGAGGVGLQYQINKDTQVKAKVLLDQSVLATFKHFLAPGFFFMAGAKYNIKTAKPDYGMHLCIE